MSTGSRTRPAPPLALLALLALLLAGCALAGEAPRGGQLSIEVDWQRRSYFLHVPPALPEGEPVPLVLVFHGGGGDGRGMEGITGFSDLADQEGFIVAYPDGIDQRWRSQPETTQEDQLVNDVGFISALIDALARQYNVDRARVYAAGISNGAVFSHRLACELPTQIAAIAVVAGTLSANEAAQCAPGRAVPVLAFHGTADAIIPYAGGTVRGRDNSEDVLSVEDTITFWQQVNGCLGAAQRTRIPHLDEAEETQAERAVTGPCRGGSEVVLYTIDGGGHTWPGGAQYLPEALIGKTNRDLNATELIWEFFARHPMP